MRVELFYRHDGRLKLLDYFDDPIVDGANPIRHSGGPRAVATAHDACFHDDRSASRDFDNAIARYPQTWIDS
jgi:hypothetical protein